MQLKPISELTHENRGELLFLQRLCGDGPVEDTFAGSYCDDKEHPFYAEFVNPSGGSMCMKEVKTYFTHFIELEAPNAPVAD